MKVYNIYLFDNCVYCKIKSVETLSGVKQIVNDTKYNGMLIKVNSITITQENNKDKERLIYSKIFVDSEEVCKKFEDITIEDTLLLQRNLTYLYKTDGTKVLMPNKYRSIKDVKKILSIPECEWFTIKIANVTDDIPQHDGRKVRLALLFYDWEQFKCKRKKVYNKYASDEFGIELFGDILVTDENFIS